VSPAVVRPRARLADPGLALPVLAGTGALLLRVVILETPDITRAALLATVFTAILVASLLVPTARDVARLATGPVILVGLVGVALAAVAAGPPVPASFGTAGLPLAILAAVAEEALFRRAAYGWLARRGPAAAVIGSALLFAAIHIPLYGAAAFPVDLGAGLLLSWQRWASGIWTVPAATHAAANLLAVVLR
jgi:membrane protease YdiL (CAAX protease family)